jgi:hypothetical protein
MRGLPSSAAIAAFALIAAVVWAPAAASTDAWSAAATLASCGAASAPKVVFPFSSPTTRSGEGAVLWLAGPCGGAGRATIDVAALDSSDEPGVPRALLTGPAARTSLAGPLYAFGTTHGQIVAIAGASGSSGAAAGAAPQAVAGEGFANAALTSLTPLGAPDTPLATMDGFIGDADVATVTGASGGGYEIVVRAQRHYAKAFGNRLVSFAVGAGKITALALGMDFRADRLVVWAQGGELWARYVTNDGRVGARQLLGPTGYDPQVSTVLSDDHHAFVIWTDEPAPGAGGATTVLLAHSGFGPRFHGAQTLASFTEPPGVRLTAGAVAAERLSSEGVALLWPAIADGNYVVDAAGATTSSLQFLSTLAEPGQDLRLGAVATGPDNEIAVLVELAPRTATGFDQSHQAILATRSNVVHGTPSLGFGPLVQLAPSGPNVDPAVAVDPGSDTALAAWQTDQGDLSQVQYSIGAGDTVGGG